MSAPVENNIHPEVRRSLDDLNAVKIATYQLKQKKEQAGLFGPPSAPTRSKSDGSNISNISTNDGLYISEASPNSSPSISVAECINSACTKDVQTK